ncbi:S8 family serine peptidase [Plantactinospora sp. KBS50]|uniref:S8 family serine peptidase n=1 Tax=Plantactinospora sp. KBS50 TaxID=2024580 RepID=UPI0012FD0A06|nr:S8 family serine peptidase [Plantactinospora sp. KBS50]
MTKPPDQRRVRVLMCSLLGCVLVVLSATAEPATAAPSSATPGFTKYYVVPDSPQPERLWDVAAQFLGDGSRYPELLALNRDRLQADGGTLTEPDVLHPGWLLILPWDAAGAGISYGTLPPTSPGRDGDPTDAGPGPPTGGDPPPGSGDPACVVPAAGMPDAVPWAQLRLAPTRAWTRSRGAGTTVAVVDTGVDHAAPALAGRVLAGQDAVPGGVAGDGDCLGHGTAMAGIIAAGPREGSPFVGMAPEATILPIRIRVATGGDDTVRARVVASGIRRAVAGGARVIAVTAQVDLAQVDLSLAIDAAITRDAVIVVPAAPDGRSAAERPGLLRVGAAGADGSPAVDYPPGTVDVLAPGVRVTSIGPGDSGLVEGTGVDFAVPFVAGLLALVRSADPDRSAVAAARAVRTSAGPGSRSSDPDAGRGFIDPAAAVGAAPLGGPDRSAGGSGSSWAVAVLGLVALLLGALAVVFHLRASGRLGRR